MANIDQPTTGESIVQALDEYIEAKDCLERFGSFEPSSKPHLEADLEGKRVRLTLLLDIALRGK